MNQFNLMLLVFFAYVLWQATKNHFKPQQMSGLEWADFTLYGPASEEKLSFQNGKLIRSLKFSGIFGHFHPDQIFRSSTESLPKRLRRVKAWPFPVTPRRAPQVELLACAGRIIATTAKQLFGSANMGDRE